MKIDAKATVVFSLKENQTTFLILSSKKILIESNALSANWTIMGLSLKLAYSLVTGAEPLLFSIVSGEETHNAAVGSLQYGRLRREILLTIMDELPSSSIFFRGLKAFISEFNITTCRVMTVSKSPFCPMLPTLGREIENYQNVKLYVADLGRGIGDFQYSSNHKRNISKAIKSGVQFVRATDKKALAAHFELTSASVDRRSRRGESIALRTTSDHLNTLLDSGQAQIYQATLGGETLSSKVVFPYGCYAFYYDGGTSEKGMKIGASHFLMSEIMRSLRSDNMRYFNMGLAAESSGDLWRFKKGFDTDLWIANNIAFDCSSRIKLLKNGLESIFAKQSRD